MAKEKNDAGITLVKKNKAKQDDLPGVEPSSRRIAELEDLGDELADWEDKMGEVKHRRQEAEDNLIAAMKRRDKTYYNRQTWGSIVLKQASEKCKVKKETVKGTDEDAEDGGSTDE